MQWRSIGDTGCGISDARCVMNHIVAPDAESQGDKEIRGKWTNQKFEVP